MAGHGGDEVMAVVPEARRSARHSQVYTAPEEDFEEVPTPM